MLDYVAEKYKFIKSTNTGDEARFMNITSKQFNNSRN